MRRMITHPYTIQCNLCDPHETGPGTPVREEPGRFRRARNLLSFSRLSPSPLSGARRARAVREAKDEAVRCHDSSNIAPPLETETVGGRGAQARGEMAPRSKLTQKRWPQTRGGGAKGAGGEGGE